MESLNKTEKTDRVVSFIITLQVTLLGVKNVLVQGFPFLFAINTKLNIVILSLVSLLYLYAFFRLFKRNLCSSAVLYYAFILISIVFSFLFFPQNKPYILEISLRWIVVLFATGYLVAKLKSLVWLQKYMLLASYVMTASCLAFAAILSVVGFIASDGESNYSLSMSYVALWAVMWQLHAFFKQSNKLALIAAIITTAIILVYGSRNPLIAIAVYVLIQVINNTRGKSNVQKFFSHLFLCLIALLAVFWKQVLLGVFILFEHFGISSRSINYILEATESDVDMSSGRNDIHEELIKLIYDHPFFGMGICGDSTNMNETAHSLYLSIYATYGIIIGTFFLLFIIQQCLSAFKKAKGLDHQVLLLFFCLVFPRGFTGGDIWESDVFWFMMGLVFMILNKKTGKNAKNSNYSKEDSVYSVS